MNCDAMAFCADLLTTDAIQDMVARTGISVADARRKVLESSVYDMLYDFETGLWQEGPDYIASLIDFENERKGSAARFSASGESVGS